MSESEFSSLQNRFIRAIADAGLCTGQLSERQQLLLDREYNIPTRIPRSSLTIFSREKVSIPLQSFGRRMRQLRRSLTTLTQHGIDRVSLNFRFVVFAAVF